MLMYDIICTCMSLNIRYDIYIKHIGTAPADNNIIIYHLLLYNACYINHFLWYIIYNIIIYHLLHISYCYTNCLILTIYHLLFMFID